MDDNYSSWAVGWSAFAGIMLVMGGIFQAISGIVAIADESFYVISQEWIFEFDVTTWGWIHLILGVGIMLAGFGIFSGNVLARIVGVAVAVVGAIVNFAWLPYAPVWSIIMITVNVLVIWALSVHGTDITETT